MTIPFANICNMFAFIFIYISKRSHFIFSDPSGLNLFYFVAFATFLPSLFLFLTRCHFFLYLSLLLSASAFFNLLYGCYLWKVFSYSVERRIFLLAFAMMPSMSVNCVEYRQRRRFTLPKVSHWKSQRYI